MKDDYHTTAASTMDEGLLDLVLERDDSVPIDPIKNRNERARAAIAEIKRLRSEVSLLRGGL